MARAELRRRLVRDVPPVEPGDGEVRLRVDAFAVTANNLTYAVTGDRFGYWDLFPAGDGWGRVPAWGVVTVESSACDGIEVGRRFTGMVPMSTHVVVRPETRRDGFVDRSPHRAAADAVYHRYVDVDTRDDDQLERDAAVRPAFVLSFVLAHRLQDTNWSGATRVLVTSASSKAAIGLAHVLSDADIGVVGMTSAARVAQVEALGVYDEVLDDDHLERLARGPRTVLVDLRGSAAVRDAVADRLGNSLVDTVRVGQTDWDRPAGETLGNDAGAFFAPAVIQELVTAWGAGAFARRLDDALQGFTARSHLWLTPDHRDGRSAVAGAWDDVAAGAVPPDRFVIVRPHAGGPVTSRPGSSGST